MQKHFLSANSVIGWLVNFWLFDETCKEVSQILNKC